MTIVLTILLVIVCVCIIAVVLLQSGKTAGLSGAIGGGSDTFLAKNKNKSLDARLSRVTKWFGLALWILVILLNIFA